MPDDPGTTADIERAKLEIEREKLVVEREKLSVERYKARWSAIAVGVPLVALAATVGLGVWNQDQQSRAAFSLKAAEIIMATDSPNVTHNKATALRSLFPDQLSRDFANSFDPNSFGQTDTAGDTYRSLVSLLASKPESAAEVLRIWRASYPDEKWIDELSARVERTPLAAPSAAASAASAPP